MYFCREAYIYTPNIAMDWFSWLSKTDLDPSLVHEYAIVFFHNELEEDDICYFNHEFLLSMGISVAKHRLEILKLARKGKQRITRLRPIIWFLIAIKQTKKYLAKRIRQDDSALSIVPAQRSYSSRWKAAAMLKSNKKFMAAAAAKQGSSRSMLTYGGGIIGYNDDITQPVESGLTILMLTNGSPTMESPYLTYSFSSPNCLELSRNDKVDRADGEEDLANSIESMRWESMFQDLKPT